jgi:hypothetical protein
MVVFDRLWSGRAVTEHKYDFLGFFRGGVFVCVFTCIFVCLYICSFMFWKNCVIKLDTVLTINKPLTKTSRAVARGKVWRFPFGFFGGFLCVCLHVSLYVSNHFNHCIKLFAPCGPLIGNKKFLFLFLFLYAYYSPKKPQEIIFMFSDCTARSEPIKYHHKSIHI